MNLEEKLNAIVNLGQPDTRGRVEQILRDCEFTSADDPGLNALYVQAVLASQPIQMVTNEGCGVATSKDMARLGDRVQNVLWGIQRMKWHVVLVAFLVFFAAGIGTTLIAFKLWPQHLTSMIAINHPKEGTSIPDVRLTRLNKIGADFIVETSDNGDTYVFFTGKVQPESGRLDDGRNYFIFKP